MYLLISISIYVYFIVSLLFKEVNTLNVLNILFSIIIIKIWFIILFSVWLYKKVLEEDVKKDKTNKAIDENIKKYKDLIKKYRKEKRWTQEELAAKL